MTRSKVAVGLGAAIAFQLVVLAGMVVYAAMPLWTGTEIRVKTVPVDPRSMFRGNYAQLRYEFATLPEGALSEVGGGSQRRGRLRSSRTGRGRRVRVRRCLA